MANIVLFWWKSDGMLPGPGETRPPSEKAEMAGAVNYSRNLQSQVVRPKLLSETEIPTLQHNVEVNTDSTETS